MKKLILTTILITLLSFNYSAQSHMFYTTAGNLVIADLINENYYNIQECWNIWDYAFDGEKLFVLSSSFFLNKKLCNQNYFEKIYYCVLTSENLTNLEFKEINVEKPQNLFLSPNNKNLLIQTADARILLNTKTLNQDSINLIDNMGIVGWWSDNNILVQTQSHLKLYDINNNVLDDFIETFNIDNYFIDNFTKISDEECLFRIGDKYLSRGYSLSGLENKKISIVYSAQWYFLDYQFLDKDNILILDQRQFVNRGNVYYLTNINNRRQIKTQFDLSEILNLSFIHPMLKLAENTLDNTFIIAVDDLNENRYFIRGNYDDSIKADKINFKRYYFPVYMADNIRTYDLSR